MTASLITVPAFASAKDGVRHFFGTRHHVPVAYETGVPSPAADGERRAWLLSVKRVRLSRFAAP